MPDGRHTAVGMTYRNGTEVVMMGSAAEESDMAAVLSIMASMQIADD